MKTIKEILEMDLSVNFEKAKDFREFLKMCDDESVKVDIRYADSVNESFAIANYSITNVALNFKEFLKIRNEFTKNDLKLFDIVEYENGLKQMVVSIEEEKEFSCLNGGGNSFEFNINESYYSEGKVAKVWRPKNRGRFGSFLNRGFEERCFNLIYERQEKSKEQSEKEKQIEDLKEEQNKLKKQMDKVSDKIDQLNSLLW